MSDALGEFDAFALEAIVHDRDTSGVTRETLREHIPTGMGGRFFLVEFLEENQPRIVQAGVGSGECYSIEAELESHDDTDAHSLMECLQDALDGTGLSVVHECGSRRYYIVSQLNGGEE